MRTQHGVPTLHAWHLTERTTPASKLPVKPWDSVITDRDEPVADLRPIPGSANPLVASLKKLAADGAVTLPQKQNLSEFTAIRSRAGTASGAVAQDRDGRG